MSTLKENRNYNQWLYDTKTYKNAPDETTFEKKQKNDHQLMLTTCNYDHKSKVMPRGKKRPTYGSSVKSGLCIVKSVTRYESEQSNKQRVFHGWPGFKVSISSPDLADITRDAVMAGEFHPQPPKRISFDLPSDGATRDMRGEGEHSSTA